MQARLSSCLRNDDEGEGGCSLGRLAAALALADVDALSPTLAITAAIAAFLRARGSRAGAGPRRKRDCGSGPTRLVSIVVSIAATASAAAAAAAARGRPSSHARMQVRRLVRVLAHV